MTRPKKILLGILASLLVMLIGGYFVANHFLDNYSRQVLATLAKRGKKHSVVIEEPHFGSVGLSGLRSATWSALYADLQFPNSQAFDPDKQFEVRVGEVTGWLSGADEVTVDARDVVIVATLPPTEDDPAEAGSSTSREEVRAKRVYLSFQMQLTNPLPGLESAVGEMVGLVQTGSSTMPVVASGTLEFHLNDSPVQLGIRVEEQETSRTVVLSAADLHAISSEFQEPLTEAEVALLASHPLRAAQLLRIKNDAETTSAKAKRGDDALPQDAYRHVLWSYLLTTKYGAQFAQQATDAHEEGDTGNTPAERAMDYRNNEVGRAFAAQRIRRGDLLRQMELDPNVVRQPE